ncbi:MAG TPA: 2-polyprenyl-3-methyl-6-methoxy-1,4-benzoquinone monooxygenase [Burkholderiaceae bacterium]|jgi:ubiquinone biosynthesis monooxygenase Coq7|nr:2-polyprenyl-3-methyl-6-methoxy-1,4-benzoquinone monooxygenase [Burkholderiaceae bacterium]HPE00724.1 2-polyprenyl-3-methyl-6-methoxy-1,4-benzoquinone monooxygenase [Burkholderiaceae bacterium]HRZ00898.1 2-polyprenyl-3-methyl-6-methoxy-1,4-benzoquinone monooxygenase [Burkholderiaceae bacterium]
MGLSTVDQVIGAVDRALRTVAAPPVALRPSPARGLVDGAQELGAEQRAEAAALMRVNHVGEVCAQALYDAQALATRDERLRSMFRRAAEEETDHLAWTQERVEALGGRLSVLNPLWYAGAFAIGLVAARAGDRLSLGFMAETERQVEAHLDGHLDRLPREDLASRAVVEQMKADEVQHANTASDLGGADLPFPLRLAMRVAAKVMTTTAHRI